MSDHLVRLIESVAHPRIMVVGDLILDRYIWGQATRISPEGPIPVLEVTSDEVRPGGAGNVVSALQKLGASVSACGAVGDDEEGRLLIRSLKLLADDCGGIIEVPGRPTTIKTRYVGFVQSARRGMQHMLRVDRETREPLSGEVEEQIVGHLRRTIPKQDAIVISDYAKGMLTQRILRCAIETALARKIPIITDPKMGRSYSDYRGSTVMTPNRYETQVGTGIPPGDEASCRKAAEALIRMAKLHYAVITLDRDGMYLAGDGEPGVLLPSRPREVYDVTGAGDMVVSVLALMLASGAEIHDAVALANTAAGIEVTKVGAAPVTRDEIVTDLMGGDSLARKLKTLDDATDYAGEVRRRGGKVVWTNGCFDILHVGHYEYLKFARRQGNALIVGLNSDESVRRLKGPNRPITGEAERARILAALDVVDAVVIFEEDTPVRAISAIKPDVLVKGGDYVPDTVVGGDIVKAYGGTIAIAPLVEGVSTTDIVKKVLERYAKPAPAPKKPAPRKGRKK